MTAAHLHGVMRGLDPRIHPSSQKCFEEDGLPGRSPAMTGQKKIRIPYPRPQNLAYPARVLSNEGRFMRRSEVGQSESWPEGQPEG
jgi:hypothetical protein